MTQKNGLSSVELPLSLQKLYLLFSQIPQPNIVATNAR